MRLVFRPEAQDELLEAQAWYESRSAGLGYVAGSDMVVVSCFHHRRRPGSWLHGLRD